MQTKAKGEVKLSNKNRQSTREIKSTVKSFMGFSLEYHQCYALDINQLYFMLLYLSLGINFWDLSRVIFSIFSQLCVPFVFRVSLVCTQKTSHNLVRAC